MSLFGRGKNSTIVSTKEGEAPDSVILPFSDDPRADEQRPTSCGPDPEAEDVAPVIDEASSPGTERPDPERQELLALFASFETRLIAAFDQKLAVDSHKEKQIDRLHEELQAYKADLVAKAIRPMTSALIKVHAGAVRTTEALSKLDPSKLTIERVSSLFDSFRDEVETALNNQDIRAFRTAPGSRFDPKRQVPIKTVPAPSPELVGTIVRSLGSGFEQAGTVIDRENTEVYGANSDGS